MTRRLPLGPGRPRILALVAVSLGLAAAPAGAEEPAVEADPPPVALEKLLKLPDSYEATVPNRGRATPSEWRARFTEVRDALAEERAALERSRAELEKVAGSSENWQVGPPIPGADASDAPLDYRLRQQIRRQRQAIESLEKDLRELEVEANLAGVPDAWRTPSPSDADAPQAGAADPLPVGSRAVEGGP